MAAARNLIAYSIRTGMSWFSSYPRDRISMPLTWAPSLTVHF